MASSAEVATGAAGEAGLPWVEASGDDSAAIASIVGICASNPPVRIGHCSYPLCPLGEAGQDAGQDPLLETVGPWIGRESGQDGHALQVDMRFYLRTPPAIDHLKPVNIFSFDLPFQYFSRLAAEPKQPAQITGLEPNLPGGIDYHPDDIPFKIKHHLSVHLHFPVLGLKNVIHDEAVHP